MNYPIDITYLIQGIIGIAIFLVTTFLIPVLREICKDAKNKNIVDTITRLVGAAEQMYRESGMGAEKKAYVMKRLAEKNIVLNEAELNDYIEDAVLELNRENKKKIEVIEESKK